MEPVFTIIGTIASIVGAFVAVKYAKNSKESAKEAKKVRDQLIGQRKTSELSKVQVYLKKAQNAMVKYGPASTPALLRGVHADQDAREVQDFLLLLKEHRAFFGSSNPNDADVLCETLNPLLGEFVAEKDTSKRTQMGGEILSHINNFTPNVKKVLDTRKDKIY